MLPGKLFFSKSKINGLLVATMLFFLLFLNLYKKVLVVRIK